MKLHTESLGAGPELVLLHGWGMNGAIWTPVMEALSRRHRVTLIELPGHGFSDYDPRACSLDAWTEACLAVAPPQAAWIGWSLGGLLAQRAALTAPGRVERLLLVASTPRFVQGEDWAHAMAGETLQLFAANLEKNHTQTLERFLSLQVRGDEASRDLLRRLRQDLAARPVPRAEALTHGLELLREEDLRSDLCRIRAPLLWLLGQRDTLVPAGVAAKLISLHPRARVTLLPGCAHAPFLSHAAECLSLIESFIGEADG